MESEKYNIASLVSGHGKQKAHYIVYRDVASVNLGIRCVFILNAET